MVNEDFIELPTALMGKITIAISQISSLEPELGGTKLTLKEMKNGENVVVRSGSKYEVIVGLIFNAVKQK